jgi:hypothetical protein
LIEQWLATAATNGAVVLWNIPKSMKLKQETVYYDHKRTVNKVNIVCLKLFKKKNINDNCLCCRTIESTLVLFDGAGDMELRSQYAAQWLTGWNDEVL